MAKRKNEPMLFREMEEARDEADDASQLRFDMFKAVGEAVGANLEGATRIGCGVYWKAADTLIEVDATPADVHRRMAVIAEKGDKFRTVGCLLKYWGEAGRPPKYKTPNFGVSTKPDGDEYDENLANIERVSRSERVAELDESERNRLTRQVLADANETYRGFLERIPHQMNFEICKLLDGERK